MLVLKLLTIPIKLLQIEVIEENIGVTIKNNKDIKKELKCSQSVLLPSLHSSKSAKTITDFTNVQIKKQSYKNSIKNLNSFSKIIPKTPKI